MVDGLGPMGIAVLLVCSWVPSPGNSAESSSITLDLRKLEDYGCAFPLYHCTGPLFYVFAYVRMNMDTRGQPWALFLRYCPHFFEIESLLGLGLTKEAKLADP